VDLKEIRTLIDLMKKNGLTVFKMEREGFKITMKTASPDRPTHLIALPPAGSTAAPAAQPQPASESASEAPQHKEIKSPMVGTFYAASSPEAAPYVSVGQEVNAETVVCIIEAMKVMNEIKAEVSGAIVEVCAENGKPVQFGQVLFRVK
jgi:acetyl-CoA carboxylase biotin carboxyl carrier protein